jgi:hypothetical protein
MTSTVVDFENLISSTFSEANTSTHLTAMPRWERKKLASMNSSQGLSSNAITPSKTPKKSRSESNIGGGNNENCRFIPNRNNLDLDLAHSRVTKTPSKAITSSKDNINNSTDNTTKNTETSNANVVSGYNSALASTLNVESSDSSRILSFKEKAPPPKADTVNNLKVLYTNSTSSRSAKTTVVNRNIT